jgi:hypothetical protein
MTRSRGSATDREFRLIADYRGSGPVLDHQLAGLRAALQGVDASIHGQVDDDSIGFDLGVSAPDFGAAVVAGTDLLASAMAAAEMAAYEIVAVEAFTLDEHARRLGWSNRRSVWLAEPSVR